MTEVRIVGELPPDVDETPAGVTSWYDRAERSYVIAYRNAAGAILPGAVYVGTREGRDVEVRRAERHLGYLQGRWARENVPGALDLRGGEPLIADVVTHTPEWAAGYVEGARPRYACDTCPFTSADPVAIAGHNAGPAGGRGWFGNGEQHRMTTKEA